MEVIFYGIFFCQLKYILYICLNINRYPMTKEQRKSIETIKKFPKGLKMVYMTSDKAIMKLVSKGHSSTEAEGCVLEVLKECDTDLRHGNYSEVVMVLKQIFNV
jgi:hypothetical protein